MNKTIKSILIVIAALITSCLVGITTINAADTITVQNVWRVDGINFRNTTSGKPAYCINKKKEGPKKGDKLTLTATYKKGPYVYIINNTSIAGSGNSNKSREIRQKAIWYYKGESIDGSYTTEAKKLANAAKNAGSDYEINPTIVSVTKPVMTKSGSYYTSQKLTVSMKDTSSKSYTVTFSGAPAGTQVIEKSGLTFKVRVPVSSVSKTTSFKVIVTGPKSSYKYVKVYYKSSGYQNLAVAVSENKTPSKTVSSSVSYKTCHIVGTTYYGSKGTVVSQANYYKECNPKCVVKSGVYYDKNGKPVSETTYYNSCNPKCSVNQGVYYNKNGKPITENEYYKECNPSCEIKDNVYYNKNGKPVTEDEYNKECNPSCEIKDNVYYNKNGKPVTEDEYNKECNPSCEIKDNVYYNKNGKPVTEDEYNKECNPSCEIKDNVYYNKNGKPVTEDEYNKECNPSCEIKDDVYYNKNGKPVTEDEYNKECNPSCKVVNNTYYGKNNNNVTKEVYEAECVIKKVKVPNSGSNKKLSGMILGLTMIIGSVGLLFKDKLIRKNM